ALIVQTGETFRPRLTPWHSVDTPGLFVARIGGVKRDGGDDEPVPCDEQPVPLRQFGPDLGSKLAFGIRRHDAARVHESGERPKDDPGYERRFADAMAG